MTSDPGTSEHQQLVEEEVEDIKAEEEQTSEDEELAEELGATDLDEDVAAELVKAQATIKEYWEQIMRLNAEMDNHHKRAQRDVENAHKYALKNFAESLLPVADSMEMGLSAALAENANLESIQQGVSMTLDLFRQTMEKSGIKVFDPQGEKFDPEYHQAMSMQESVEMEPNTVIAVMQKGYLLNERLLRPAMVVVSKAKS